MKIKRQSTKNTNKKYEQLSDLVNDDQTADLIIYRLRWRNYTILTSN